MFGAIGDVRPKLLIYELLCRGLMGQTVGYWDLRAPGVKQSGRL